MAIPRAEELESKTVHIEDIEGRLCSVPAAIDTRRSVARVVRGALVTSLPEAPPGGAGLDAARPIPHLTPDEQHAAMLCLFRRLFETTRLAMPGGREYLVIKGCEVAAAQLLGSGEPASWIVQAPIKLQPVPLLWPGAPGADPELAEWHRATGLVAACYEQAGAAYSVQADKLGAFLASRHVALVNGIATYSPPPPARSVPACAGFRLPRRAAERPSARVVALAHALGRPYRLTRGAYVLGGAESDDERDE